MVTFEPEINNTPVNKVAAGFTWQYPLLSEGFTSLTWFNFDRKHDLAMVHSHHYYTISV